MRQRARATVTALCTAVLFVGVPCETTTSCVGHCERFAASEYASRVHGKRLRGAHHVSFAPRPRTLRARVGASGASAQLQYPAHATTRCRQASAQQRSSGAPPCRGVDAEPASRALRRELAGGGRCRRAVSVALVRVACTTRTRSTARMQFDHRAHSKRRRSARRDS